MGWQSLAHADDRSCLALSAAAPPPPSLCTPSSPWHCCPLLLDPPTGPPAGTAPLSALPSTGFAPFLMQPRSCCPKVPLHQPQGAVLCPRCDAGLARSPRGWVQRLLGDGWWGFCPAEARRIHWEESSGTRGHAGLQGGESTGAGEEQAVCECVHRAHRARVHRVGFAKRPHNEPTSEGLRESKRVGLCTPRLIERRQQGMLHDSRGSLGASPLLSSSLSSAKISGRRFAAHQPAPGPFLACRHSARLGHLVSAGQGCGGDLEPPPRPVGSPVMCLLVPSPKPPL